MNYGQMKQSATMFDTTTFYEVMKRNINFTPLEESEELSAQLSTAYHGASVVCMA